MCWARSFFSSIIEAQLATGATQDMRILIGSALLATPPNRPNAKALARANFMRRILSSRFPLGLRFPKRRASQQETAKIVGCPTDFGKSRWVLSREPPSSERAGWRARLRVSDNQP